MNVIILLLELLLKETNEQTKKKEIRIIINCQVINIIKRKEKKNKNILVLRSLSHKKRKKKKQKQIYELKFL